MHKIRFCAINFLLLSVLFFWSCQSAPDPSTLRVTFQDLKEGESTLVECQGKTALFDTGDHTCLLTLSDLLQSRKIQSLDYLILTHPHADHIGCAEEIIRRFSPKVILAPKIPAHPDEWETIQEAANEVGSELIHPECGAIFSFGNARFTILSPASAVYSEINDYSLVVRLVHEEHSFLFTGDAQASAENEMLHSSFSLSADVLKVAHHGSSTSSTDAFLDAVSPTYALISVPEENDAHPAFVVEAALKKRGATIYRTDLDGRITILSAPNTLEISTEK